MRLGFLFMPSSYKNRKMKVRKSNFSPEPRDAGQLDVRSQQGLLPFTASACPAFTRLRRFESLTENFWNGGLGNLRKCRDHAVGRRVLEAQYSHL